MGIDIYLGGYDAYKERTAKEREAFNDAVRIRDAFPRGSAEAEEAQKEVDRWSNAMWGADKGYLRSSYNSGGLFNVLETIYGVDVAALLFPGSWDNDVPVNVTEWKRVVDALVRASAALKQGTPLPILYEVKAQLGTIPDAHPDRIGGEAFGQQVFNVIAAMPFGKVEGGYAEPSSTFDVACHGWYVREGLLNLARFADLAERLEAETGQQQTAYISY